MAQRKNSLQQAKISPEFKARLDRLEPQQQIQAIVLLDIKDLEEVPKGRQSAADRQKVIEAIRQAAKPALIDVDKILARFDGKRLKADITALGYMPVETTAAGVAALAQSEHVKAIFEDQPISLLSRPK